MSPKPPPSKPAAPRSRSCWPIRDWQEYRLMRSRRLDPLLKVVQERQDTAARQVAERDRVLAEQQERLDALRRYAEEYAAAPSDTTTPALLVNRLAFRERL